MLIKQVPRSHPDHPCGLYKLIETRKLLNQLVESAKANVRDLQTNDKAYKAAVASQLTWADTASQAENIRGVHFLAAVENAMVMPMISFTIYRHLQSSLNRARKFLQKGDTKDNPCDTSRQFMKELYTFFKIISKYIVQSFHSYSKQVPKSLENHRFIAPDKVEEFWASVGKIDERTLAKEDKTVALIHDVKLAKEFWDSLDSLLSFFAYMQECPSERRRFNPTTYSTIITHIALFIELAECYMTLTPETCRTPSSCRLRYKYCKDAKCGLRNMSLRGHLQGFLIWGSQSKEYRDMMTNRFIPDYIDHSYIGVSVPLRLAVIKEIKALQECYEDKDSVIDELIQILDSCHVTQTAWSAKSIDKPTGKLEAPFFSFPDLPKSEISQLELPKCSTYKNPDMAPSGIETLATEPTRNQVLNEEIATEVKNTPNTPPRQSDHFSSKGTPKSSRKGKQRQAKEQEFDRGKTISKYNSRGYGSMSSISSPSRTAVATAAQLENRIWIVKDPTFYQEVWRVIFPRTRSSTLR